MIYNPDSSIGTTGVSGNSIVPTINNGGGTVKFQIISAAITGLTIDSISGVITWSNTLDSGTYFTTVQASNSVGNISQTYKLKITPPIAISTLTNFNYLPNYHITNYAAGGQSISPQINNNGSAITYSLVNNLNSGITIDSTTGIITWDSSVLNGNYTIVVKASNTIDFITTNYVIYVLPIPDKFIMISTPKSIEIL